MVSGYGLIDSRFTQINKDMKKIIIQLTTFRGQCVEAIHYYVSVAYYDSDNNYCSDKIKRPITQSEIDADKDRFYSYEAGDLTECFVSWEQALEASKEYILSLIHISEPTRPY